MDRDIKLSFFPTPYPDELWYSVLCRYHARSGNVSSARTTMQLFGQAPIPISRYNADNLHSLLQLLPDCAFSKMDIVLRHTFYPFFTRFMNSRDKEKVMFYLIYGNVFRNNPSSNCHIKHSSKKLMYCPLCTKEDMAEYGECYWHISHQIFSMVVCPHHHCLLCESTVSGSENTYVYEKATIYNCPPSVPDFSCSPAELLFSDTIYAYQAYPFELRYQTGFREKALQELRRRGMTLFYTDAIFPQLYIVNPDAVCKLAHILCSLFKGKHETWLYLFSQERLAQKLYSAFITAIDNSPTFYAMLSVMLELPPAAFISTSFAPSPPTEIVAIASRPYAISKETAFREMDAQSFEELYIKTSNYGIARFWDMETPQAPTNGSRFTVNLSKAQRDNVLARMKELGIADVNEYLLYCIRCEMAQNADVLLDEEQQEAEERFLPDASTEILIMRERGEITVKEAARLMNMSISQFKLYYKRLGF